MERPTYDFEEAIKCINDCTTLHSLIECQSIFRKDNKYYSNWENMELEARCYLKTGALINEAYIKVISDENK